MAIIGYQMLVRKSGVSTAVTTEPLSITGTGSVTFRITDSTRRVIDPSVDFHLKNGTTTLSYASIVSADLLNGEFVLSAAQAAGSVSSLSFTGSYLPITTASDTILAAKSFKLGLSTDMLATDVFTGSTAAFVRQRMPGLRDGSLEVTSIAAPSDLASLATAQFNGSPVVAEVFFGDAAVARFRGVFLVESIDTSTAEEGLAETSIGLKIAAVTNTVSGQVAAYCFKIAP